MQPSATTAHSEAGPSSATIAGLDLIRFAAALMVAWYHLAYWFWTSNALYPDVAHPYHIASGIRFEGLAPSARWGWVGVEIFFVLSGFVIAYTAQSKSATQFLRARFLRLYPVAWICTVVSATWALAYAVYPADDFMRRLWHALLITPKGPWIDGAFWTLGIELAFYALVFAVLAVASYARLAHCLTALGLISSLFWLAVAAGVDLSWFWTLDAGWALSLIPFGGFFTLGSLIWRSTVRRLSFVEHLMIALTVTAGIIEILWAPKLDPAVLGNPWLPAGIWLLAVGLIALSAVQSPRINSALAPVARGVRLTGLATYPLYLLHNTTGTVLIGALGRVGFTHPSAAVIALLAVIALSYAIAAWIEPRLRNWTARAIDRLTPGAAASAARCPTD